MPLGVRVETNLKGLALGQSALATRSAALKAVTRGIQIISAAAKTAAPRRSGGLKVAQGTKAKRGRKGRTGAFAVQGAKTKYQKMYKKKVIKPFNYDHLVIGGVKPHGVGKGKKIVKKRHPGARANPYRLRAYQSVESSVNEMMIATMQSEVNKLIARMAAKAAQKGTVT